MYIEGLSTIVLFCFLGPFTIKSYKKGLLLSIPCVFIICIFVLLIYFKINNYIYIVKSIKKKQMKNLKIENEVCKYFNIKRFTKNKLINFIEMKLDYNQDAKKYINYFEQKYKEKY